MSDPTTVPVSSGATDAVVVRTRGLRKNFEAEGAPVRALRGVDFEMRAGEFVSVMGPSGCGKSTLLNLVAGLDSPTDGELELAGTSLVGKTEDELAIMRRRHIGIVFQFFNLLEGMTALENVTLPAVIAGAPRKRAETRARDLLDLLGLAEKAKDAPGVLSGGQRQRLAIARPSPTSRHCSSPTSLPVRSTPRAATRYWSCSAGCTPTGRRSCSSRTTTRSPTRAIASCSCATARSRTSRCAASPTRAAPRPDPKVMTNLAYGPRE